MAYDADGNWTDDWWTTSTEDLSQQYEDTATADWDSLKQLYLDTQYEGDAATTAAEEDAMWETFRASSGGDDFGSVLGTVTSGGGGAASTAMSAINRALGLGGPSGTGLGAISAATAGLGGTGLLAALAALTSKPSTTSGETSQTGTSAQDTTGATAQETSQTQDQTSKVSFDTWYENMVKAQAEDIPTEGYQSFDGDMLNLPNGKTVSDYMMPYMDMVATPVMRRQAEDQALQQQKFNAERVSRGAFGSGRADLLSNQMQERQALERDNTLGSLYNQAFGSATGLAKDDLTRAFDDWKLLQGGGTGTIGAAKQNADMLKLLAPGATTTVTGATTGATTGSTAGATTSAGDTSYTGADPNRLGQLAGLSGTIWGMANPNGLPP